MKGWHLGDNDLPAVHAAAAVEVVDANCRATDALGRRVRLGAAFSVGLMGEGVDG